MAKVLASVIEGKLFDGDMLYGTVTTATESTFGFNAEELPLKGGRGNNLIGTYYHSAEVTLNCTVQETNLKYLAMKCGSDIELGSEILTSETVVLGAGGKGVLTGTPVKFENKLQGWAIKASEKETENYQTVLFDDTTNEFTFVGGVVGEKVCVTYFYNNDSSKFVKIMGRLSPKCLHFVGIADLYEDNQCIGQWDFDIPRFMLSPTFELSMQANGTSTMAINGKAGLVKSESCDSNGDYYCKITETLYGKKWQDDCTDIFCKPADIEIKVGETETIETYAIVTGVTSTKLVKPVDLVYDIPVGKQGIATVDTKGVISPVAEGHCEVTVSLDGHPEIKDVIAITVIPA